MAAIQSNTPVLTSVVSVAHYRSRKRPVDPPLKLTWYIYHRFEPSGPLSASILLLLVPIATASYLQASFLDSFLTLISHWFLLLTLTIGYRLSPFHPLARYPGPALSKVSKFWTSVVSAKGYNHRYVRELHQKYGDIVRIGKRSISSWGADIDFAQVLTNSHFVALTQSFLFSAEVYERAHVRDSVFDLNVN